MPRDRNGEFEPKLIPKYQRDVSGIEEQVISLYARGMSTRDIHDQLKDLYGIELSAEMVSKITDKILPQIKEWHSEAYRVVPPSGSYLSFCIHGKDVLFFCVDGLSGFKEAISAVYPQAQIQRCVIHMLRNSFKYVNYNDLKKFSNTL